MGEEGGCKGGGHRGEGCKGKGVGRGWEKGGDVRVGGDGRRGGCKGNGRRKKGGGVGWGVC